MDFRVAAIGLEHGHIYGMCQGLEDAGVSIVSVYDEDEGKVDAFCRAFPGCLKAMGADDILSDPSISLVVSASVPCDRAGIGIRALEAGKDFFSDKPSFVTMDDVEKARSAVERTAGKWFVYYSERLHSEASVYAEKLIRDNAIGRVLEIRGWGPHRIGGERPGWFYDKAMYGGILVDIASHQIEQTLFFAGADNASVVSSRVGNLHHEDTPGLEDFGDAMLITDNGVPCYINVDWFTPSGLGTWGDGRFLIIGTKGYIELRKYIDVAAENTPDHVILVNEEGEYHYRVHGKVGYPFFRAMIDDCISRSESAIRQEHVFRASELAIEAEEKALVL